MTLPESLRNYIDEGLSDCEYYKQLAEIAPDQVSKQVIYEMANDEMRHAEEFKVIYHSMTGDYYNPSVTTALQRRPYRESLQDKSLSEGYRYGRYMSDYNRGLGDAILLGSLFGAGVDKNLHSIALLYLLSRL
ncbi:ferritin family protein [Aminipila terrae]|uniref:Rubrerythrin diiron-binding domain-containing protein n=1 Tax=Aminipila terrae TaxID=2697030 RepID=A0A6P1MB48_9FIRM|nr:ferritin family protein [Aminipila terrae]QHI71262.1 hypothetical protein Ami3637_01595 [Aminipila terrae]